MLRSAFIMLLGLNFCHGDETISGYSTEGATWRLVSIDGAAFTSAATIAFPEKGKVTGNAPCNSYFGKQTVPYPWFELQDVGTTRMTCPDFKLETKFFGALTAMTISEVVGSTLILSNEAESEMVFEAN